MANTQLTVAAYVRILSALLNNPKLKAAHVDLARNNIGPRGANDIAKILSGSVPLLSLSLADNGIKEGICVLPTQLPHSLERLVLDQNLAGANKAEIEVPCHSCHLMLSLLHVYFILGDCRSDCDAALDSAEPHALLAQR